MSGPGVRPCDPGEWPKEALLRRYLDGRSFADGWVTQVPADTAV